MADSLAEVKQDARFWQRLLRLGGYYKGKTDGIIGKQSWTAAAAWEADAEKFRKELGTFDERTERNLATLLPSTQRAARLWLRRAKPIAEAAGLDVRVICGTRTYAEQTALYKQRPRVTKAAAGQSMHNFGIAWDIGIFQGKSYHGDHKMYRTLGQLAVDIPGIEWGGAWKSFVDEPHFQLTCFANSADARRAFEV